MQKNVDKLLKSQECLNIYRKYKVKSLYLFGSYARGEATKKSDVDLLVGYEDLNVSFDQHFGFIEEMEHQLQAPVDVAVEGSIRPWFREIIQNDLLPVIGTAHV